MSHDSPEAIRKTVKKFLWAGAALIVLSGITVLLSYVEMPTHGINILVGMIVAAIKASLVALIFMHLISESTLIYKVLAFTGTFVTALFILFYLTSQDPLLFKGFYQALGGE